MTLFIGVENNSYSSEKIFSSEKIVQTMFNFKVYYSIKEGQAQSALSDLQMYEDQKEVYRKKIEELGNLVMELDPVADDYDEKFIKYSDRTELMNKRLDGITQKIKELSDNKLQAERAICNQIVDKVRARKKCLDKGTL